MHKSATFQTALNTSNSWCKTCHTILLTFQRVNLSERLNLQPTG